MRTRNLDEAIEAVSKVYCPHAIRVTGPARNIEAVLEVPRSGPHPLVQLSYSASVAIDAYDFSRLYLMMRCARGSASTRQEGRHAEWRQGQTLPFSAGLETKLRFDRDFAQTSVRLDVDQLETLCARWLGHPLERPLRFAPQPFTPELERIWDGVLGFLQSGGGAGLPLAGPARAAFDEFLLALVLQHHPHNYRDEMLKPETAPLPWVVRRAEQFMRENASAPITTSSVAAELGIGVRTLQSAFRQWRAMTPGECLRAIRLHRAREELRRAAAGTSITAVALRWGFPHVGRFSARYRAAFNELPKETLRRRR